MIYSVLETLGLTLIKTPFSEIKVGDIYFNYETGTISPVTSIEDDGFYCQSLRQRENYWISKDNTEVTLVKNLSNEFVLEVKNLLGLSSLSDCLDQIQENLRELDSNQYVINSLENQVDELEIELER